jgi:hypothetical protein
MDEARRVLERLRRIEELRDARAEPGVILGELRSLLVEGEDWIAAERAAVTGRRDAAGGGSKPAPGRAARALAGLADALNRDVGTVVQRGAEGPPAGPGGHTVGIDLAGEEVVTRAAAV